MFKYINPGDYRLLDNKVGVTFANSTNPTHAPKTGISFTTSTDAGYPIKVDDGTKELWIKFDVYLIDTCSLILYGKESSFTANITLATDRVTAAVGHKGSDDAVDYPVNLVETVEAEASLNAKVSTILVHIKSAALETTHPSGKLEIFVNNVRKINIKNIALFDGAAIGIHTLKSATATSYFSNIIVSDSVVKGRENCAILPIASTNTDGWSQEEDESGNVTFTTNAIYATITRTINVPALKNALGVDQAENMEITGIFIRSSEMATDDAEAINAIGKYVKVDGAEYNIGHSIINETESAESNVAVINPKTNAAWTITDLETLELVMKSEKVVE